MYILKQQNLFSCEIWNTHPNSRLPLPLFCAKDGWPWQFHADQTNRNGPSQNFSGQIRHLNTTQETYWIGLKNHQNLSPVKSLLLLNIHDSWFIPLYEWKTSDKKSHPWVDSDAPGQHTVPHAHPERAPGLHQLLLESSAWCLAAPGLEGGACLPQHVCSHQFQPRPASPGALGAWCGCPSWPRVWEARDQFQPVDVSGNDAGPFWPKALNCWEKAFPDPNPNPIPLPPQLAIPESGSLREKTQARAHLDPGRTYTMGMRDKPCCVWSSEIWGLFVSFTQVSFSQPLGVRVSLQITYFKWLKTFLFAS